MDMAKKRPKVDLAQSVQPRTGDLEKLFATDEDIEQTAGLQLLSIRVDAVQPDPHQPRRTFPEDSLLELSESIKQEGVIQPIEVTESSPNTYMIVHGERRWRAAQMAGMETIPAVVRRRDYDTITRLVRQLVENIQREDLNDIDRAAGLLRLREMLQAELDIAAAEGDNELDGAPWARTITWAKVGKRIGTSRQRIHQLIRLLDLPDVIKEDVRAGKLSERETRIYQGLPARQQRDLHRERYKQALDSKELKQVVQQLKDEPAKTVSQAIREVRQPLPPENERAVDLSFEPGSEGDEPLEEQIPGEQQGLHAQTLDEGTVLPSHQRRPTNIDRLDWIRGHLARVQRHDLSSAERQEMIRLLNLIQHDVSSLLDALELDEGSGNGRVDSD